MDDWTRSQYLIAPDVVFCELQDRMVLLDTQQGQYFALNSVASDCWALLADGRDLDEISDRIAQTYDVTADACRADIASLLDDLFHAGLVAKKVDA